MSAQGRPYWLHQGAEYVIGLLMLLMVTRAHGDAAPLLVAGGALVLINVTISGPPAGCVRMVSRPVHRWTDVGVVAALVAIPIVLHDRATSTVWITMIGCAVVLLVIRLTTNYRMPVPRVRKPKADPPPPAAAPKVDTTSAARNLGKAVRISPRALGRAVGKTQRPPPVP
jgi:hypothetical protein